MCFTFKRFKKSSEALFSNYSKNSVKVIYDQDLDLTKYFIKTDVKETFVFELESVVCHNGNLQSGHYTAYARHLVQGDNIWFYFSDQYHKQVEIKDVLSNPNAFMLFYRRKLNK